MLVNLQSNTDPLYKGLDAVGAVGAVDPPQNSSASGATNQWVKLQWHYPS